MALKKRRDANGAEEKGTPAACSLSASFPTLAEFLTSTTWEDGSARTPGTVMLFVEDGRWKGWLHDRDGACSCFVSNSTMSNLLACLDAGLADDSLEWRPDKPRGSKRV